MANAAFVCLSLSLQLGLCFVLYTRFPHRRFATLVEHHVAWLGSVLFCGFPRSVSRGLQALHSLLCYAQLASKA